MFLEFYAGLQGVHILWRYSINLGLVDSSCFGGYNNDSSWRVFLLEKRAQWYSFISDLKPFLYLDWVWGSGHSHWKKNIHVWNSKLPVVDWAMVNNTAPVASVDPIGDREWKKCNLGPWTNFHYFFLSMIAIAFLGLMCLSIWVPVGYDPKPLRALWF